MYSNVFEKNGELTEGLVKDRRATMMVRNFMLRSDKYREPYIELAKKSRELYETWRPASRSIIQRANLKLPFGFTIVETEIPQLVDIFVKDSQVLTLEAKRVPGMEFENTIADFLNNQLTNTNFPIKFVNYVKCMLLDGTAIAKVPYRYQEKVIVRRESVLNEKSGEMEEVKFKVAVPDCDGPEFEVIPLIDFFPDWSIRVPGEIQKMRGLVHRTRSTLAALRAKKRADGTPMYKNLDELEQSLSLRGDNPWSVPYFESDKWQPSLEELQDIKSPNIKSEGSLDLWEYWGLYDPNDTGKYVEYLIVIANGDVCIREEENLYDYKFKPFVATPNIIRDNEFYGIPEVSAIRALIKEANTVRNARLDAINLAINPMILLDRNAGVNVKSLYSRPGGIILTNDINGLKPFQLGDPSMGSIRETQDIQQDIQQATAQPNATPGLGQFGRVFGRSATGANYVQGLATSRISIKALILNETLFKPMTRIMLLTNRQFVTDNEWLRVSDPNSENPFKLLPADAFYHDYEYTPMTDYDTGGIGGDFQKMQTVSQVLQVAEATQPGVTKFDVLLEALLRPILGNRVKKFVRTEEERQQMQAQGLAMQQAMNAAKGQAAPQPNAGTEEQMPMSPEMMALMGS